MTLVVVTRAMVISEAGRVGETAAALAVALAARKDESEGVEVIVVVQQAERQAVAPVTAVVKRAVVARVVVAMADTSVAERLAVHSVARRPPQRLHEDGDRNRWRLQHHCHCEIPPLQGRAHTLHVVIEPLW